MSTFNVGDLAYSLEQVLLKRKDITFLLGGMRGKPDGGYHEFSSQCLERIITGKKTQLVSERTFSASFASDFPNLWTILLGKNNNEDDLREVLC